MRDIFSEREDWKKPVAVSAGLHLLFAAFLVLGAYVSGARGNTWGGDSTGESVSASLVSSIPLLHPQEPTQNILANDSKGQTQSVPQPLVEEKPEAIPIQENPPKHRADRTPVTPMHDRPQPTTVPQDNRVPFGQGGAVTGTYATFASASGKGGGSAQDGSFGDRYPWYVKQVINATAISWEQIQVPPNVGPHRFFVTFDVQKDGKPVNIRILQSSSVPMLDTSAQRALDRIDSFGSLPSGYSGTKVSFELWFDFKK